MKCAASLVLFISVIATGYLAVPSRAAQKDYLSALESDKVRDAEGTNERIKLFLLNTLAVRSGFRRNNFQISSSFMARA